MSTASSYPHAKWSEVRTIVTVDEPVMSFKIHVTACQPTIVEFPYRKSDLPKELVSSSEQYLERYYALYMLAPRIEWVTVAGVTMAPIREIGGLSGVPALKGTPGQGSGNQEYHEAVVN